MVRTSIFAPVWDSGAATDPCLVMGAVGWRVTGFRFYVPATDAAIIVPCTQAPWGANAIGIRSVIDNCYFDGSVNTGQTGIDLHGAPYNACIIDNVFGFLSNGILSTNTGYADAYRAYIAGNWFHESTLAIDASLNVSAVLNNVFQADGVTAMTTILDLRTGTQGENVVSGNVFGGDYSNTGGYYANAANPANHMIVDDSWSPEHFDQMEKVLKGHNFKIDARAGDVEDLKRLIVGKRAFLLRLLENPNLLEHDLFTEVLWAVFHLAEELSCRTDVKGLPENDYRHLAGDIKRAYRLLVREWLAHMEHLKNDYPYLFSLAARTNPFDPNASPEVQ